MMNICFQMIILLQSGENSKPTISANDPGKMIYPLLTCSFSFISKMELVTLSHWVCCKD